MKKKPKTLNYYFLNKYIHPKAPRGYRENIVALIINKSKDERGKFLLVQEKNDFWNMPKKAVTGDNLLEGVLNALVKDIGDELGFKGIVINENNPQFVQKAIIFNFGKQEYDEIRSKDEKKKKRPTKGKLYHLVVVDYTGPNELPIKDNINVSVKDYRWATEDEVRNLAEKNVELNKGDKQFSTKSAEHNIQLSNRILNTYKILNKISEDTGSGQMTLLK